MVLFIVGLLVVLGAGVHAQVPPPPPPPPVTPTQFLANKCFSACPLISRTHVCWLTQRAQAPSPPRPILPARRLPIPSALTEPAPRCVPSLQAPALGRETLALSSHLGPLRSYVRAFAHARRRCRATALRCARVDRPHRAWQCGVCQLSVSAARRATFSSRPLARSTSETLAGVRWSWLHR